jgi:hypothetical protein
MLAIAKEWGLLWEVPIVPLLEQRQRRDVFDQEVEIQIAAKARQPLQDVFVTMMDTDLSSRRSPGSALGGHTVGPRRHLRPPR